MSRLLFTIIRTTRLDEMKAFYGGRLGLETAASGPDGVEYRTRGATLALRAVTDPGVAGIALRFATPDLQAECARLEARGIPVGAGITDQPAGRLAEFRDPEDNLVGLLQPQAPRVETEGPTLGAAIVNCRDFGRAASFYRDRLGLPVAAEGLHWMEFDTGETRLALRVRPVAAEGLQHASQPIALAFHTEDLDEWSDRLHANGIHFASAPVEADFGVYAEAVDPDGNVMVFRQPLGEPTVEELLAEAFEDDEVPQHEGMRKPLKKGSKAVSRLAIRPDREAPKKKTARGTRTARSTAKRKRVASPRGTGPAGSRRKPKSSHDTKRAKTKPATGRLKKAARAVFAGKKRAVARASRSKPVKRASASRGRRR